MGTRSRHRKHATAESPKPPSKDGSVETQPGRPSTKVAPFRFAAPPADVVSVEPRPAFAGETGFKYPDPSAKPSLIRTVLILIGLALITGLVFYQAPSDSFINYDDNVHVYQNSRINPVTLENLALFWWHPLGRNESDIDVIAGPNGTIHETRKPYEELYAPVFFTAYAALAQFAKLPRPVSDPDLGSYALDPRVFHTANVVLHVMNVLLLFFLLKLLVGAEWPAAAGALLFGVHPVQVEPVSWVTGLNNVLSGTFGLAAIWIYLLAGRDRHPRNLVQPTGILFAEATGKGRTVSLRRSRGGGAASDGGAQSAGLYLAALVLFVLALLTKPISVVLVPIVWILDVAMMGAKKPISQRARAATVPALPWLALALAVVAINAASQPDVSTNSQIVVPAWFRVLIMLDSFAFYLGKLLWPANLGIDYARTPHVLYVNGYAIATCWVPVVAGILIWRFRSRFPVIVLGAAIFFISLLPMSGLVPYYFHAYSVVADRYLYLAMIGPSLALAALLAARPKAVAFVLCMCLLCALAFRSVLQTSYWSDSATIYRHTLEVCPRSYLANYNYGSMLTAEDHPEQALPYLRRAVAFNSNPLSLKGLADALTAQAIDQEALGNPGAALASFQDAMHVDPVSAVNHGLFGNFLLSVHNYPAAVDQMRAYEQLTPVSAMAHFSLGVALEADNQWEDAAREYREALTLQPDYPEVETALHRLSLAHPATQ